MEPSFLAELEAAVTNVGTDVVWKRQVADRIVWLSPLSYTDQLKVQDTLVNEDLGSNAVQEAKRLTLSHAIVGFDALDLRPHRGSMFPGTDKAGKRLQVTMDKYVYQKIQGWSSDFVDLVFEVFADQMESFKNDLRKDVKFENAKDPYVELAELEERARVLRTELGLPQLAGSQPASDVVDPKADAETEAAETDASSESEGDPPGEPEAFNPFRTIARPEPKAPPKAPAPTVEQADELLRSLESPNGTAPPAVPPPSAAVPVPIPGTRAATAAARAAELQALEQNFPLGTPQNPYRAMDSIADEPLDAPAARNHVAPPVIDRVGQQSRNPRFVGRPNR